MASTNFVNGTVVQADWLNDVNKLAYGDPSGAGMVGFIQSGTGAVDRTLQDKGREVVSVKDFGAVGDGVTDDWQAIQKAVAHVSNRGGGVVFFPVGTYLVKYAIDLKSNVHYLGEDREATVIKAHATSIDNIFGKGYPTAEYMPLARAAGGTINRLTKPDFLTTYTEEEALINGGMSGYAVTHVLIENMTIDGNQANRQEANNYLKGTLTGTFLSGETVTSSSGGSAMVTGAFTNIGCSIEPRTITGTFNIGDTITGVESGKTMVIASKEADDAYQLNVRFDGVSHSTVRNCVFRNSIFTAMSLYNASNYNTVKGCLFHNNHKPGTTYTAGYMNIYVEFDNNYNIIRDNLLIGGLGYSILVSCSGGVNRDTYIINNTILNSGGDGIRVALDGGVYTIFAPRVIGNTVANCTQAGAVGIRFLHNGGGGSITDGVIIGNTVRDCPYGILTQGTVQYTTVANNTCRNNTSADISVSGVGVVAIGNTADSQLQETLANKLSLAAGRFDPLKLYSDGGHSVGMEMEINGIGTWYDSANYPNGDRHFEFGGSRKVSISTSGDLEAIRSIKGASASLKGSSSGIVVGTVATVIATLYSGNSTALFLVAGDNGSAGFHDLVMYAFGTITVISSNTSYGLPAARTYSQSGTDFMVSLASGTLIVRVVQIANEF